MVITYRTLGHVAFPAFPLPSSNWEEQDGLLYLDNKLLDDKNMKGKFIPFNHTTEAEFLRSTLRIL